MADLTPEVDIRVRTTKKLACKCHQPYQDGKYGPGRRLANKMKDPGKWRCTGCGVVHTG